MRDEVLRRRVIPGPADRTSGHDVEASEPRVTAPPWRRTLDGVVIACRLTPKGGRDGIDGVATLSGGARVLLARVRSAPEDGRANQALCRLFAEKQGVAASAVRLVAGAKSRVKQVAATGEPADLLARCEEVAKSP